MILSIVVLAVLGGGIATNQAQAENTSIKCPGVIAGITFYRNSTWSWQEKLGVPHSRAAIHKFHSCGFASWTARTWRVRSHEWHKKYIAYTKTPQYAFHQLVPIWLFNAFVCIHRYEGAWNDNTGNGYYGGLQMDLGFQGRYGSDFMGKWGTADNWPIWAQLEAAARAYFSGRHFYPWPNTARACGLL